MTYDYLHVQVASIICAQFPVAVRFIAREPSVFHRVGKGYA